MISIKHDDYPPTFIPALSGQHLLKIKLCKKMESLLKRSLINLHIFQRKSFSYHTDDLSNILIIFAPAVAVGKSKSINRKGLKT
jgi:hypothetical protein